MDPVENQVSSSAPDRDLQAQVDRLRQLLHSVLVLVIVVSGTLTIYLLREVRYSRAELQALRPNATNIITQYEKTVGPNMDQFVRRLATYGKTHPDFQPILTKYSLNKSLTNAPAGAKAPSPAVPAQPAKK